MSPPVWFRPGDFKYARENLAVPRRLPDDRDEATQYAAWSLDPAEQFVGVPGIRPLKVWLANRRTLFADSVIA